MAGFCRLGGVGCVLSQLSTVAASAGVVVEAVRWQWVGGCNGPESRRKIWELGPYLLILLKLGNGLPDSIRATTD